MYVYLIETKAVHFSAFPALFYLTLVLSTILIRSTTWIRWRPGICGLQARVHVHQPPCSQGCKKLAGSLGTRLRTHLLLVSNNSNTATQAWWGQSVTSWSRSFVCEASQLLYEVGQQIVADSHHGVWQAETQDRPSVGKYNNISFNRV